MKLTSLGKHLLRTTPYVGTVSGLANQFCYRPLVPIVEVQFQHIDAVNLKTAAAIYGTVNATQYLTMGFNVIYLKIGQQTLTFCLYVTSQGLDFRNRDLEDLDNPAAQWTIREVRAKVTYESQTWNHQQKLTPVPTAPWHRFIETSRGR